MELFKNTRVVFDEGPHEYTLDGHVRLLGVTSLMKKQGLSADYSGIDEETLAHAATLGSEAHQVIENYCNGLPTVDTPLVRSFAKLGVNTVATEYLVSDNELVASSVDLVVGSGENSVELWDMKRTSTVHRDALAWQLGIYKYLFELANPSIKVTACKCLPIKKGNKDNIDKDTCGKPIEIKPVTSLEVETLLQCERDGAIYIPIDDSDDSDDMAVILGGENALTVADCAKRLAEAQGLVKMLEDKLAAFKDSAYQYMLSHDKNEIKANGIRLKLKRPYNSSRFDSKGFKAAHPQLAEEFTNVTEVKGNVTITIN